MSDIIDELATSTDISRGWNFVTHVNRNGGAAPRNMVLDVSAFLTPIGVKALVLIKQAVKEFQCIVQVPGLSIVTFKAMVEMYAHSDNKSLAANAVRAVKAFKELRGLAKANPGKIKFENDTPSPIPLSELPISEFVLTDAVRPEGMRLSQTYLLTGDTHLCNLWLGQKNPHVILFTHTGRMCLIEQPRSRVVTECVPRHDAQTLNYDGEDFLVSMGNASLTSLRVGNETSMSLSVDKPALGKGTEAVVYSLSDTPGMLAKVYKGTGDGGGGQRLRMLTQQELKSYMYLSSWEIPDVALPRRLVYSRNLPNTSVALPVGYTMPTQRGISMETFLDQYKVATGGLDGTESTRISLVDLADLVIDFVLKVKCVHQHGALLNDYGPQNFLVDLEAPRYRRVKLIDTLGYTTGRTMTRLYTKMAHPYSFRRETVAECLAEDACFLCLTVFNLLMGPLGGGALQHDEQGHNSAFEPEATNPPQLPWVVDAGLGNIVWRYRDPSKLPDNLRNAWETLSPELIASSTGRSTESRGCSSSRRRTYY